MQGQTLQEQEKLSPVDHLPTLARSVSLEQAAKFLQVSRRTIYNRIKDGQLATIRTYGSQRVLVESLQALARQS